jgi:hypothetical protein
MGHMTLNPKQHVTFMQKHETKVWWKICMKNLTSQTVIASWLVPFVPFWMYIETCLEDPFNMTRVPPSIIFWSHSTWMLQQLPISLHMLNYTTTLSNFRRKKYCVLCIMKRMLKLKSWIKPFIFVIDCSCAGCIDDPNLD